MGEFTSLNSWLIGLAVAVAVMPYLAKPLGSLRYKARLNKARQMEAKALHQHREHIKAAKIKAMDVFK